MSDFLEYSFEGEDFPDDDISFNMETPARGGRHSSVPASLQASRPRPHGTAPTYRFRTSSLTPEEQAYQHRQLFSLPKIPSYTEALVRASRLNRERAQNPFVPVEDPPRRIPPRLERNPVKPLPSVIASTYYRDTLRGIYDRREPLFNDFLHASSDSLGYYDLPGIYGHTKSMNKLSIDDEESPANKGLLSRRRNPLEREETPSERLLREHASNRVSRLPEPLPRIRAYHRSMQLR